MNVPLEGSIRTATSVSARLHILGEEELRIAKIAICILTSAVGLIYLYFDTSVSFIVVVSVCVVLLLLMLDALSPKNRVIGALLKIHGKWDNLLDVAFTLNIVLPGNSLIRYITYFLSFFWITFRLEQWFAKELKNPMATDNRRLFIMIINILFVMVFVCLCLIRGTTIT